MYRTVVQWATDFVYVNDLFVYILKNQIENYGSHLK